jgi:hypothetical protein
MNALISSAIDNVSAAVCLPVYPKPGGAVILCVLQAAENGALPPAGAASNHPEMGLKIPRSFTGHEGSTPSSTIMTWRELLEGFSL